MFPGFDVQPKCSGLLRRATFESQRVQAAHGGELALAKQDEIDGGEWSAKAGATLEALIRESSATGRTFSVNDIREACGEPSRPGAWGPLFGRASRAGRIHRVGEALTNSPRARARFVSVWSASSLAGDSGKRAHGSYIYRSS